ncbi:MAG: modification methylase [Anaerolineaceae bacterium]|nr:modification methylase [Anaerolineaceae bacterium]
MTLAKTLNSYEEHYWDFSNYRNDSPLVRYPAVMVAPMQEVIMKEIIKADNTIHNVLDPFFGSGTVLYEGKRLGLNVVGFDINPLAVLITRVKLEGIPIEKISDSINALNTRITLLNGNVAPYCFTNITKWFNDDVILSLSIIRQAIIAENDELIRRFFWSCFAETVKQFSNTRTSTFKLHIKEEQQIASLVDDSISFFKKHIQDQYSKFINEKQGKRTTTDIRCGDSKELLKTLPLESVDLIYSSPPYGDNHTTVTYGQFSILPLLWIDKTDLSIWNDHLLESFTAIDTASLGGSINSKFDNDSYKEFLNNIIPKKQKKVISFFNDYESVFKLLTAILKPGKLMVLTLGNRHVDSQEIYFDKFNDMLAKKYGLKLDSTITRNIIGKRMPKKVSRVENYGAVNSINKEYVKIYRKVGTYG